MVDSDPWALDSGLVSNYEGTIIDSWFGIDTNYNADATLLFLKMSTDSEKAPEITERYNCGPDWHTIDGGETVTHPTKDNFNNNTQVGKLIAAAVKAAGVDLTSRGAPSVAKTWLGTRWFMAAVHEEGTFRAGDRAGQKWETNRNFPSKFLGWQDVPSTKATPTTEGYAIDPTIYDTIKAMAKLLQHQEWVDKVLEVDGVLKDEKLVTQLPDTTSDGLYERLKNE